MNDERRERIATWVLLGMAYRIGACEDNEVAALAARMTKRAVIAADALIAELDEQ